MWGGGDIALLTLITLMCQYPVAVKGKAHPKMKTQRNSEILHYLDYAINIYYNTLYYIHCIRCGKIHFACTNF